MKYIYYILLFCLCGTVAYADSRHKPNAKEQIVLLNEPDAMPLRPGMESAIPHVNEIPLEKKVHRRLSSISNVRGIDVSHYQGNINWRAVAGDRHSDYVYLKCSESSGLIDNTFHANLRGCRSANLPVGAYHFFSPTASPFAQLENMTSALPSLRDCDLVPMIDVEKRGKSSIGEFIGRLRAFLREVERHYGVRPIIYTGENFYKKYLNGYFNDYIFMIAKYGDDVPDLPDYAKVAAWQYSAHGSVAGIRGSVDLSCFINGYTLKDICIHK